MRALKHLPVNEWAEADRAAFRQAAENALGSSPQCWGEGSIHRTVVAIWRIYFHPSRENRNTTWDSGKKKLSKPVAEPPTQGLPRPSPLSQHEVRRTKQLKGSGDGLCGQLESPADRRAFDVGYAPYSGAKADIVGGPSRATSRQ